jgi:hypothetical protein
MWRQRFEVENSGGLLHKPIHFQLKTSATFMDKMLIFRDRTISILQQQKRNVSTKKVML